MLKREVERFPEMESRVVHRSEFGGSLPVDNVQHLASNNLKDIPSRYIRSKTELDVVAVNESLQIPVIDMAKLGIDRELEKLHMACKDWGFFQLINHGVEDEVIEKMKFDIQEFFKLPLEEKMACAQLPNTIEGYGQAFVVSEDQKLDWGDMLFLLTLPVPLRNMNFWPTVPTSLRETLDDYSMKLHKVALLLIRLMATNLGIEAEKFSSFFEDGTQGIRMNYYPPCPQANKVIGLSPHSDATGLTLLVQVNDVEGLQIKKHEKWVPIKPIPGAFVVNIGDIIEIMSNGEYKSIEHRAVVNPNKERLSIAAFHSPKFSAKIGPLSDIIKVKKPEYKTMTSEEFIRMTVSSKLDGKSLLERMKL